MYIMFICCCIYSYYNTSLTEKVQENNNKKLFEFVSGDEYWNENTSYKRYNRPSTGGGLELFERLKKERDERLTSANLVTKPKSGIERISNNFINTNTKVKTKELNDIDTIERILNTEENTQVKEKFDVNKHTVQPVVKDTISNINKLNDVCVNELFHKVNRMGPYYSHCFYCSRRNADFYNVMRPDSALKILNHIKDTKKLKYN
jgi:hypothetical protein